MDGLEVAGACTLVLYHVAVLLHSWRKPLSTFVTLSVLVRERWALRILEDDRRSILAIQTLRNATIITVFYTNIYVVIRDL